MKNGETNSDEFSKELAKRGWREIDGSHREHIPAVKSARDMKSRITIYLDADIVIKFKEIAEAKDAGYQTLINETLREIVDGMTEESAKEDLKEDLLKDKKFLRRLKAAMSV